MLLPAESLLLTPEKSAAWDGFATVAVYVMRCV